MAGLQFPNYVFLIIPFVIILVFLLRLNLVKFHLKKEQDNYDKRKTKRRRYTFIFHLIILILLTIALSSPYTIEQTKEKGNPSMVILSDASNSFDLYQPGLAENLKAKLDQNFPVSIKEIASSDKSALGDGILANMQGDDNLLLVTDGRSTHGRNIGDILQLAYQLNSTISMLKINPIKTDVSVSILGPDQQIEQVETEFLVDIDKVGDINCPVKVELNGNVIVTKNSLDDFTFSRTFPKGTHKLKASVLCDDHFAQNNEFYKTIRILDRPRVLFLAKQSSPLDHTLTKFYRFDRQPTIPSVLDDYDAIVVNDYPADELRSSVSRLTNYVAEGNGLVVIGGKNSYDFGGYKNSLLEAMLPVQVGVSDKTEEGKLNIVVVLDISGSTGASVNGEKKVDIEKSLAIDILKDIRVNDKVGVIAFNTKSYVVSPLGPLSDKKNIVDDISKLKDSGGTEIFKGIRTAQQMLSFAEGGKNIVIISDGLTWFPETVIQFAQTVARSGTSIHTVGVGENTDRAFMRALAKAGGGIFLESNNHETLKIIFDNGEPGTEDRNKLTTLNRNHFVTSNVELTAKVTGFNQVAPKQSARTLVTTLDGIPIVAEHRFGLGRIVSVSTDDGILWAGQLHDAKNSILWSRIINYAIGNPMRKNAFTVQMTDTFLGDPIEIKVKSDKFPTHDLVTFHKIKNEAFTGTYLPKQSGFYDFFGTSVAVNYPKEYQKIGVDPSLPSLVSITGGKSFTLDEVDELSEFVRSTSIRFTRKLHYWRWPFIAIAVLLFLGLLVVRRLDGKNG